MIHIEQFKDYYLTRRIGIGGMAEIFRAWKLGEEGFEKQVVVKRLLSHLAGNDDFRTMFLDEARLASQLNHPNIVHVYDLGRHTDQHSDAVNYFIAMEYVFGKNLAEVRNKAQDKGLSLSLEYLVRIIAGAASALHYAHEKKDSAGRPLNIVHRDVSPQNILISYEGDAKLVDFGIAKALTKSQHTQAGVLKGKLAYMSPEQARGETIDRRADIYALGVVFWEFLTGMRLFAGESEASVLHKVLEPKIESPASISSMVSSELEAMCMKCLAPNPDDRYPDALSLAMALESHLRELTTFPGSYSIRNFMQVLFGPEIENESLQVQEEAKAVREFAKTGIQPDATFVAEQADEGKTVVVPTDASSSKPGPASMLSRSWQKIPGGPITVGGAVVLLAVLAFVFLTSGGEEQVPKEQASVPAVSFPVEGQPDHEAILEQVGLLLDKEDIEGALSIIDEEENGQPWSVAGLKQARAAVLTRKAETLFMDEDPKQALQYLQSVIDHVPGYAEAHLQIGRALTRLERDDEALQAYDQAIQLDPSLHVAYYNSGSLLLHKGDFGRAEQLFLQTLELQPPYLADVYVNLAGCRIRGGDLKGAESFLRKAVEADPGHEIAQQNLNRLTNQ